MAYCCGSLMKIKAFHKYASNGQRLDNNAPIFPEFGEYEINIFECELCGNTVGKKDSELDDEEVAHINYALERGDCIPGGRALYDHDYGE